MCEFPRIIHKHRSDVVKPTLFVSCAIKPKEIQAIDIFFNLEGIYVRPRLKFSQNEILLRLENNSVSFTQMK